MNDLMIHNSSLCFMSARWKFLFLKFTIRKDLRLDSLLTFFVAGSKRFQNGVGWNGNLLTALVSQLKASTFNLLKKFVGNS